MENEYPKFSSLKTSTITMLVDLKCQINIFNAFFMLPITIIKIPTGKKLNKKNLPHCQIPGSIISMRILVNGKIVRRGLPIGSAMKNSITLLMSIKSKNLTIKLSPTNIHITGCKSVEQSEECAYYLFQHISNIKDSLKIIKKNDELAAETLHWIEINTKGKPVKRSMLITKKKRDCKFSYELEIEDNLVDLTKKRIKKYRKRQSELGRILFDCFLGFNNGDQTYHKTFIDKIKQCIEHSPKISKGLLEIKKPQILNINYNFKLGFRVDRINLREAITDYGNNFSVLYDETVHHSVVISLPYRSNSNQIIDTQKIPHISFTVHATGSVTQSVRSFEEAEWGYNKFIKFINFRQPDIEYDSEYDITEINFC